MANLSCGIVGLPNVGKSTLFNAITANQAPSSNFPFCTIDPNVGVVEVFDPRLEVLSKLSNSRKLVYANMQFLDIAGLVKGASKGEGLGNKFLANIRETDDIVHVVRCFDSDEITHVSGAVDPIQDIEVINFELILSDLQMLENSLPKLERQAKSDKEIQRQVEILHRVRDHLNEDQSARSLGLTPEEKKLIKPYPLLTMKEVLYAANVAECDLPSMENPYVQKLREYATAEGSRVVPICAKLEEEISQIPKEEQKAFLESVGLEQSGLQRLIQASFEMLGLITFLTTGEIETRAWPIIRGTPAAEAAGKIHTDIQKGFIRAEVISYADMVTYKGRVGAREAGKMRSEGKDYIVKDGDVVLFLHN